MHRRATHSLVFPASFFLSIDNCVSVPNRYTEDPSLGCWGKFVVFFPAGRWQTLTLARPYRCCMASPSSLLLDCFKYPYSCCYAVSTQRRHYKKANLTRERTARLSQLGFGRRISLEIEYKQTFSESSQRPVFIRMDRRESTPQKLGNQIC